MESGRNCSLRAGAMHGPGTSVPVHLRASPSGTILQYVDGHARGLCSRATSTSGLRRTTPGDIRTSCSTGRFSSPCECGVREDRRWLGKLNDAAPDDRPAWPRRRRRPAASLDSELS